MYTRIGSNAGAGAADAAAAATAQIQPLSANNKVANRNQKLALRAWI